MIDLILALEFFLLWICLCCLVEKILSWRDSKKARKAKKEEEIRQRRKARRMQKPRVKERVDYWAA